MQGPTEIRAAAPRQTAPKPEHATDSSFTRISGSNTMIRTLALLVASLSLAPAASAFVLHLDHALSSHNPVVTLGGSPMSSAAIDVYDVSTAKGVVVVKSLAAQERYVVMLRSPGRFPVAFRLDLFEAGG